MRVGVLGPVIGFDERGLAVPVRPRRAAALLAALAITPGRAVPAERLIDAMWGERPPVTALGALRNAVSSLRRQFGAHLIDTVGTSYVLRVSDTELDASQFATLVGAPDPSATDLRDALALWRGDPFRDLPDWAPARTELTRLRELRAGAEEALATIELSGPQTAEFIALLERLVSDEPFREYRWELLARALSSTGRRADALEACQRARRVLRDELGLNPGLPLLEVESAILRVETDRIAPLRTTSPGHATAVPELRGTDRSLPERIVPIERTGRLQRGIEEGWIRAPARTGPIGEAARVPAARRTQRVLDEDRGT